MSLVDGRVASPSVGYAVFVVAIPGHCHIIAPGTCANGQATEEEDDSTSDGQQPRQSDALLLNEVNYAQGVYLVSCSGESLPFTFQVWS